MILNGLEGLNLHFFWYLLLGMSSGPPGAHLFCFSVAKWRKCVFKGCHRAATNRVKRGPDHTICFCGSCWVPMGPPESMLYLFWLAFTCISGRLCMIGECLGPSKRCTGRRVSWENHSNKFSFLSPHGGPYAMNT